MNKQSLNGLQQEVEKKYKKKEKGKTRKMKVNGAGVRDLQKIIRKKCR